MDYEQYLGTIFIIIIVGLPLVIALLGPVIGGRKVEYRNLKPLLIKAIDEFKHLEFVRKTNYEEFETDMINLLYDRIQNTDVFHANEKIALSKDVVRILVRPYMQKIYKEK